MKAIKLVLNMPAPATLDNRFGFSSTTMAQLMNPPPSLIYNKYLTQQLLFQLVTVNPIELLSTSVSSELSYNYTMRFIGYDSIQTRRFISYRFQIRTIA